MCINDDGEIVIRFRPEEINGRYILVILTSDKEHAGTVDLHLDGSETVAEAARHFGDGCYNAKAAMAEKEGYSPHNWSIDGKPRTEKQKLSSDFLQAISKFGHDSGEAKVAYERLISARNAVAA